MSCDHNREKYLKKIAPGLGVTAAHLESVFQSGRREPATVAEALAADASTRLLFADIKRVGYRPPTHSKSGMPRKDAQMGYAALLQEIARLRQAKSDSDPIPVQVEKVLRLQVAELNITDLSAEQIASVAVLYDTALRNQFSQDRSDPTPPQVDAQQEMTRLEKGFADLQQKVAGVVGDGSDQATAAYTVDLQEIGWMVDALRFGGPTVGRNYVGQIESRMRSLRGKIARAQGRQSGGSKVQVSEISTDGQYWDLFAPVLTGIRTRTTEMSDSFWYCVWRERGDDWVLREDNIQMLLDAADTAKERLDSLLLMNQVSEGAARTKWALELSARLSAITGNRFSQTNLERIFQDGCRQPQNAAEAETARAKMQELFGLMRAMGFSVPAEPGAISDSTCMGYAALVDIISDNGDPDRRFSGVPSGKAGAAHYEIGAYSKPGDRYQAEGFCDLRVDAQSDVWAMLDLHADDLPAADTDFHPLNDGDEFQRMFLPVPGGLASGAFFEIGDWNGSSYAAEANGDLMIAPNGIVWAKLDLHSNGLPDEPTS